MEKLVVAAIQLDVKLADVKRNLAISLELIHRAADKQAKLIVLPEFFTSAIALNPVMESVARYNMEMDVPARFFELSKHYNCTIAGSYLNIVSGDVYNTMLVQFPNGECFTHNKDIPTQFENRYYTDGDHCRSKNHVGVALCWEMLRTNTVHEMIGDARIVAAGSCWWDLPKNSKNRVLREYNNELNYSTPTQFAVFLGLPVVHASHVGTVTGFRNSASDTVVTRQLIGHTQIVNHRGQVQGELDITERNAVLVQEVELPESGKRTDPPKSYWTVQLPAPYLKAWESERSIGQRFYIENRQKMIGNFAI